MNGLTTILLGKACRIFLARAYPDGTIPPSRRPYGELTGDQPLEPLLHPPVCQVLSDGRGGVRGYAFRLGSAWFPHVKLQVVDCGNGTCVFGVDTHDAMQITTDHPEAARLAELQAANRRLKHEIEEAWEAEDIVTFNRLLQNDLDGR